MKWVGISGGWRRINQKIENDVRQTVLSVTKSGDGIISGGALNVDYIALDEALKYDPEAKRIKIFLPTTLDKFTEHYYKHVQLGNITMEQAKNLINQLSKLKKINPLALIENPDTNFTEENKLVRYYERNSEIVRAIDELIAFRVITPESQSLGTMDIVEKAKLKGIPVDLRLYDLSI